MGKKHCISSPFLLFFLHHLLFLPLLSTSAATFEPEDNFLLDCGSTTETTFSGRTFLPDSTTSTTTTTTTTPTWSMSAPRSTVAATTNSNSTTTALLRTARVFVSTSTYTFSLSSPSSHHFLRLHFLPFVTSTFNLTQSLFSVSASSFSLLSSFSPSSSTTKEFLLPPSTSTSLTLTFTPTPSTSSAFAFVNAIELVSTPSSLFSGSAQALPPLPSFSSLNSTALETTHRLNMGGPLLTPSNDTLSRTWLPDDPYLLHPNLARSTSFSGTITYPSGGATQYSAPPSVYDTATEMAHGGDGSDQNFNVTWTLPGVDPSFDYLVRLHFCDIVSNSSNQLLFHVYISGHDAIPSGLDPSTINLNVLASPFYFDFLTSVSGNSLVVSVGPSGNVRVVANAILNGLELFKMNNSLGSLAGLSSAADPSSSSSPLNSPVVAIGIALSALAISLAVVISLFLLVRRKRRLNKQTDSKSWRPLSVLFSSTTTTVRRPPPPGGGSLLGGGFSLAALMDATSNFDDDLVIGVGGFGKVYRGTLKDETIVAVKRANRDGSQQGLHEFRTEIELLSQLRHRHLVSLIGFCDEGGEMILVYEYMSNGTLRSHLYSTSDVRPPPLTWKQRLEICIGAARGLHYLHTCQAKAIIHRDVKSANILLDEALRAKVSDFGLSKTGPDLDKTHVSTAVKGSFGYLDPEYFRKQQLTEKSDVYSFGVVLLEVLCARPVIDPSLPRDMVNLAEWATKLIGRGELHKAIDPLVLEVATSESLSKFVDTAERCLVEYGTNRPAMGDVLWSLEAALHLQQQKAVVLETLNGEDGGDLGKDSTPLVPNTLRSCSELDESFAVDIDDEGNNHDLPSLTMSRVFSQLVKAEGRNLSQPNSFSHQG